MNTSAETRFTVFLIASGFVAVLILIVIILLPLILKCYPCRKRKISSSAEDYEHLLEPATEELCKRPIERSQIRHTSKQYSEDTEIDCAIEYRTRGNQLIIGVANVVPSSNSWRFINNISGGKLFLLVYIDGDSLNSPCESGKHDLDKTIFFNEIFIFTTMPYDLSSLFLVIQTVLVCGNWQYDIGTMTLPLGELDKNSYALNKIHHLPFPSERSLVHECYLSLAIVKAKNSVKIKIIRLYFLDRSNVTEEQSSITGLHLRVQITDFQNPLQSFDTTKKKCQQFITFNELMTFQFEKPLSPSLEIEVQLLESYSIKDEEEVTVCGRMVLYIVKDDETVEFPITKNDRHLLEVSNNPDVEIVRWHGISYIRSLK